MLGDDIDILPVLLLPLAGPDPFSDEENDQLPLDLQYLPDDKEREPSQDIRTMLLEALMKVVRILCASSFFIVCRKMQNPFIQPGSVYVLYMF